MQRRLSRTRGASDSVHRPSWWTFLCAQRRDAFSGYDGGEGLFDAFCVIFRAPPVIPELSASFSSFRALTTVSARGLQGCRSPGVYSQVTRHRDCQLMLRCSRHRLLVECPHLKQQQREARSWPGVCRCSVTSPMMGDTHSGVVARRTSPSGVASFGRVTHAPADPRALYKAMTTVIITSVWGGAREPQSGLPDGAGLGRGGAASCSSWTRLLTCPLLSFRGSWWSMTLLCRSSCRIRPVLGQGR